MTEWGWVPEVGRSEKENTQGNKHVVGNKDEEYVSETRCTKGDIATFCNPENSKESRTFDSRC